MTEDRAVELINEWLNLAKEVGDMNLNRMEYDEERYNYAMNRMNVIRQEINDYHEQMFSEAKDINSKIIDYCKQKNVAVLPLGGCVEMKNVNLKHCIINVLMLLLLIGILGIIGYLVFSPIYSFLLWRFKTVI